MSAFKDRDNLLSYQLLKLVDISDEPVGQYALLSFRNNERGTFLESIAFGDEKWCAAFIPTSFDKITREKTFEMKTEGNGAWYL
jgi:hypothetical protein